MPSIARKNLFEDIPRFLVAQAGILFSVSLMTIQVGILQGFTRSTARVIDQAQADLWVGSKDMVYFELTVPMPLERVTEVRQVQGVELAEPLMLRTGIWRNQAGLIAPIRIIGFDPNGQLFAGWPVIQGNLADLKQPYTAIMDRSSLRNLGISRVGDQVTIGSLPLRLAGVTQDVSSITSSAFAFTSLETANAYGTAGLNTTVNCRYQAGGDVSCTSNFENAPIDTSKPTTTPQKLSITDPISYVLVRARPGQDLEQLRQRLEAAIPGTKVYTQGEMAERTRDYWERRTGVGFILSLGATVGFVVGMVVVGQILYSSVADHLQEFGTLKAMGASNWVIYRVIVEQALWMAILGYLPSLGFCMALGSWTLAARGIMILITPLTAAGIFSLTIVMCVGSALFAIQKVTHVDPAIVFKA